MHYKAMLARLTSRVTAGGDQLQTDQGSYLPLFLVLSSAQLLYQAS